MYYNLIGYMLSSSLVVLLRFWIAILICILPGIINEMKGLR